MTTKLNLAEVRDVKPTRGDLRNVASAVLMSASVAVGLAVAGAAWLVVVAAAVPLGAVLFFASVSFGARPSEARARQRLAKQMLAIAVGLGGITLVILSARA